MCGIDAQGHVAPGQASALRQSVADLDDALAPTVCDRVDVLLQCRGLGGDAETKHVDGLAAIAAGHLDAAHERDAGPLAGCRGLLEPDPERRIGTAIEAIELLRTYSGYRNETLVLGRAAMGETVASGAVSDRWCIRRDGRLVHLEALRIAGDIRAATSGAATLGGCRAMATLIHAAPEAGDRLAAARVTFAGLEGVTAAASAKPGVLILRFAAVDLAPLRTALKRFLLDFRAAPLPRVWSS